MRRWRGGSFFEVLAIATKHDGDSDSTASIAGQLYGAWKGVSDLPPHWAGRIDVLDPMMSLIKSLLCRRCGLTWFLNPRPGMT